MRKLYLIAVLLTTSLCSYSQFINLPDSNLRNALIPMFPSIFNGAKQMDTVKAKMLFNSNTSSVNLVNRKIANLTGIEYIAKIGRLDLTANPISTFNKLPPSCIFITMSNCSLSTLPPAFYNNYNNINTLILSNNPFYTNLSFPENTVNDFSALPPNITSLYLNRLKYTSMPILPNSIVHLDINNNSISKISSLPNSLKRLICDNNILDSLSNLPLNLERISCINNNLTSLPTLPPYLQFLNCSHNKLSTIPSLPLFILDITANNNLLTSIPTIPPSAEKINFNSNLLTTFPNIPRPIKQVFNKCIWFANNNISILPQIPKTDSANYNIDISFNPISNINSILSLNIYSLNISGLPLSTLPDTIKIETGFFCNHNNLKKLPFIKFTTNDRFLSFAFTKVDTINLNKIPDMLTDLDLSFSNITLIPKTCQNLVLIGKPESPCLPKLPQLIRIFADSTILKCLPNLIRDHSTYVENSLMNTYGIDSFTYINYTKDGSWITNVIPLKVFTLPICSPVNNVNNCEGFPAIVGAVYVDENNNNIKDPTETFRANVPLSLSASNKTISNINGSFYLIADSIGNKTLTITAPRFYTAVPSTINFNFSKYDTLVNVPPIALQKTISKDSLAVKITPIWWAARPGFPYPFFVQYENVGSNTVNANINLSFNPNALNYDSSSTTVNATTGNIQLLRNNFTPGSQGSFISYFKVKPSASLLGANLKTWVSIVGGTALASDTTNRIIGGSYDPNDKLATPQLSTTQVAEGQFINYTVRFQNTGTDTAFTVVIADTLNSLLQANTFEFLGSSHACKTIIQDNKLYFEFRDILLPDSTTNLIGSNGFVNFRIKPVSSVVLNTVIPNKAAIYFDYNEPIITNTATTTISNTLLPTHLLGFSAALQSNKTVLLYWNTTNEINTQFFVVEQSTNAKDFEILETVSAKGIGNNSYYTNKAYTSLPLELYYRLKTIDKDGSISYSNIIKIKQAIANGWSIVTNPAKGKLLLEVKDKSLQNTQARLVNAHGQVVQTINVQIGFNSINVSNLSKGLYYVQTNEGTKQVVVE